MNLEPIRELIRLVSEPVENPGGVAAHASRIRARINEVSDAAEDALPALSQLLEAVTWQPIETAPKDRAILCYNPMVGAYNSQWVKDPDEDAGLYRGTNFPCGHWGYCGTWFCVPTHWMPLPSPPEDK